MPYHNKMNETVKKKYEERKKRAAATLRNEKADRVPLIPWRSDYLVFYYGYEMNQIDSYDKMFEIYKKADEEFDFDICDVFAPISLAYKPNADVLMGSMMSVSEDGNSVQIIPDKVEIMKPEEYDAFIKNPIETLVDTILPRRYGIFGDISLDEKLAQMEKWDELTAAGMAYRTRCVKELGILGSSHVFFTMPVDQLFDFLRNFTGISMDIRRCPDKVAEAADVLADFIVKDIEKSTVLPYSTATAALHLPPFIKPKDFERVYWPSFKKIVEAAYKKGHVCKFLFEKSWKHLFDYLEELPKNSMLGYIEREDGFREVYQRFHDKMILVGGIDTNLLARGTKEECITSIKGIIDDCCRDGGVMLAPDLPMVYAKDGKPENFKAVAETIRKYAIY